MSRLRSGANARRNIVACAALVALAGCAAGGTSPRTSFYTLSVEAAPAAVAAPGAPVRVSIARVAVPGMVDRPQLVASIAPNRVEIFDFHRWAEPLPEAVTRVIGGNLARELGPRYNVGAGALPGLPPEVRVALDVQRFDATMDAGVTVEAAWSVRPAAGEVRAGRTVVEEPATESGHAGIAAAYSRALAAVAREIAAAVAAAPAARP